MIDDIYTSPNPYPPAINFDALTRRVEFFLGDRWIKIGDWKTNVEGRGKDNAIMSVQMPDIDMFLREQFDLDNGTEDWAIWGPRVN